MHARKTKVSGGAGPPIPIPGITWRQVVNLMPWLLYPPVKAPWYPMHRRQHGLHSWSGNSHAPARNQTMIPQSFSPQLSPALLNLGHAAFKAVPLILFLMPNHCLHIVNSMCIHTHCWLCRDWTWITYASKQHWDWNVLAQIGSDVNFWLHLYHWGACLVMTGRICDVGQNALEFCQTSSSSFTYCQMFFLITILV
jgi:hypothetical protein